MHYSSHIPYPSKAFSELSQFINQINNEFRRDEAKRSLENLMDILMKQELMKYEQELRDQT